MPRPDRVEPGPDQESVWDYPRPPALEPESREIIVEFGGIELVKTSRAYRVLETSHPPVYYLPPDDIQMDCLSPNGRTSFCEFKGRAEYLDIHVDDHRAESAGWRYPSPSDRFEEMAGYIAFYAHMMDACFVGGERVEPQPGDFYGGWITSDVVGPFKGASGTRHW